MTLVMTIAAALLAAAGEPPADAPSTLEITIQVEKKAASPVAIRFTLTNRGKEPVQVLDWYTPLEGLRGNLFDVTRDGKEIPYRGILVKRGDPEKESYRALDPGKSLEATVPLSEGYDVSPAGTYAVTFDWRGRGDVAPAGAPVPRPREAHQGPSLRSNTVTFTVEP